MGIKAAQSPCFRSIMDIMDQPTSVRLKIISAIAQIAAEQKVTVPPLQDNLTLHETGFDSLAFAILVARLQDQRRHTGTVRPAMTRTSPSCPC